jgi:ABC-type glycerol-3-phosphate transport system permease component
MRQYFMTIPYDLDTKRRIDGANSFQIWWRFDATVRRWTVAVFSVLTVGTTFSAR